MWLGGLASAVLLSTGCGRLPDTGGRRAGDPPEDFFGGVVGTPSTEELSRYHYSADRGFNGTIAQLGSSIDPRTPETEGTPGRSRMEDVTGWIGPERVVTPLGIGGSGNAETLDTTSDMSQRLRRGYDVGAAEGTGSYGPGR
jgi:hypothetical protein